MSSYLSGNPQTLIDLTKGLMTDSVDPESIPTELIGDIRKVLNSAKAQAIEAGRADKVREIHHATHLLNGLKRPVSTRAPKFPQKQCSSQLYAIRRPYSTRGVHSDRNKQKSEIARRQPTVHCRHIQAMIDKENEEYSNSIMEFNRTDFDDVPSYHKRFSSELLNLRQQQGKLMREKRFTEAENVRRMADKKEEGEMKKIRMNWETYRANLKKKYDMDHKRKLAEIEMLESSMTSEEEKERVSLPPKKKKCIVTVKKKQQTPKEKHLPKSSIKKWSTPKIDDFDSIPLVKL